MRLRLICTDKSLVDGPGYLAPGECYQVGRSSRCAFVLDDLSVSRCHAEVTATGEAVKVKDLGSSNGTFVDDVRVNEVEVQPGQVLRFGSILFRLVNDKPGDAPESDDSDKSTHFIHSNPAFQPPSVEELSMAQLRVLDLLLTGLSEKEVATTLLRSEHTVHNHVKEIYRKMSVTSRPELLALFLADSKKPNLPEK